MVYTGDYLNQKRLRPCWQSAALSIKRAAIDGISQTAAIVWSIRERFNVQLDFGAARFGWGWNQPGMRIEGRSNTGFLCSGSGKLFIFSVEDTSLSIVGQIGSWGNRGGWVSVNGIPSEVRPKLELYYWQAGAAVTQKIGLFVPYLGCLVNQTTFKADHLTSGAARLHSQIVVGPFGGCSLSTGSRFFLNIEWRGWFEQGLALSGQIRF